jgi:hypothetical protein
MKITVCKIGNVQRVIHNLPAVTLELLVTSLVGTVGPSDFHLFVHVQKHQTGKQFAAYANIKQLLCLCCFFTYIDS